MKYLLFAFIFYGNTGFSQENNCLDSFFVSFLSNSLNEYKYEHLYIKKDTNIFSSNSSYNVKKVKKVETLQYHKHNETSYFIEVSSFEKCLSQDTMILRIAMPIANTYRNKKMIFTNEGFNFLVKKIDSNYYIYLDGYEDISPVGIISALANARKD